MNVSDLPDVHYHAGRLAIICDFSFLLSCFVRIDSKSATVCFRLLKVENVFPSAVSLLYLGRSQMSTYFRNKGHIERKK